MNDLMYKGLLENIGNAIYQLNNEVTTLTTVLDEVRKELRILNDSVRRI